MSYYFIKIHIPFKDQIIFNFYQIFFFHKILFFILNYFIQFHFKKSLNDHKLQSINYLQ